MRRILVILFALVAFLPVFAGKKADKQTMVWKYEVDQDARKLKDGKSIQFKVWAIGKKEATIINQAPKNAVHAILFKQVGNFPPLAGTESVDEQFLNEFFRDGGEYMRFVTLSNNGAIAPGDKQKVKGGLKIGVKVIVNQTDLRKYLESKGVIRKMNSLF